MFVLVFLSVLWLSIPIFNIIFETFQRSFLKSSAVGSGWEKNKPKKKNKKIEINFSSWLRARNSDFEAFEGLRDGERG